MNLYDILKLKFPDADFRASIKLRDDGDGPFIYEWNLPEIPEPSQADLDSWKLDLEEAYTFQQNRITNQPIYVQLEELDLKSIRALRAGDTDRLTELENQAIALRQQLLPTK